MDPRQIAERLRDIEAQLYGALNQDEEVDGDPELSVLYDAAKSVAAQIADTLNAIEGVPMTQAEYRANTDGNCPVCRNPDTQRVEKAPLFDDASGGVTLRYECNFCHALWQEVYSPTPMFYVGLSFNIPEEDRDGNATD